MCSADIFLGILALLFPPLAVWVKCGVCTADSLINICLCVLGYIPGLLHAWYIIYKFPEQDSEYEPVDQNDREGGRVTYVFVHGQPGQPGQQQQQQQPSRQAKGQAQNNTGYGTNNNQQQQQQHDAGEGSSDGPPPPSYAAVVSGDNKVQTQE